MKLRLALLIGCFIATIVLSGCNGGGGGGGVAGLFGGGGGSSSSYADGSSPLGDDGGGIIGTITNPEPATVALLGSGLFAYALLRRKKKK